MTDLHIFALNTDSNTRHTHLTRAQGGSADLPPLADWLRVTALEPDEIELFPVKDLDDMALSDYIALAFATQPIPSDIRARLDALEGSVLLVPETAMTGDPAPGAELTQIARLALVQPDHSANLPKAEVSATPAASPEPDPAEPSSAPPTFIILVALVIVLLLMVMVM